MRGRFRERFFKNALLVLPRPGVRRRLDPVSRSWGLDRGRPVDRYYIERFLERHREDIRGRVLEVEGNHYTSTFGAGVAQSDILNLVQTPGVTFVADLSEGSGLPSRAFDCIVLTQTLHLIHDVRSAVRTLHRILRPEGVLLLTAPGISQIARGDGWEDQWRFTSASARTLFGQVFGAKNVSVEARGNVLTSTAFLYGLADHELTATELDYRDADYELILLIRAVRADSEPG